MVMLSERKKKQENLIGESGSGERLITLEDIFGVLGRRKKGILVSMLISFTGAFTWHYLQPPEYRAVSIMMINDKQDRGDLYSTVIGAGHVENQLVKKDAELISSMSIAEKTVRELRHIPQGRSLELLDGKEYLSPLAQLLRPVFSPYVAFGNADVSNSPLWMRKKSIELNKRIRVEPVRDTNIMRISVASPFAEESAILTDVLCRVYKEDDIDRNAEKYAQANRFIAAMLDDQQQKVREADNALSRYMSSHKIYEVTGNTQQLLQKLVEVDARYNELMAEYNISKNSLNFLVNKLSESEKDLSLRVAKNVTDQLGTIMDEMRSAENDYVSLVRDKGPDDENTKAQRRKLDVVKARYDQLSRSKIAGQIGYAGKTQKYSFDMVSEKLLIERKLHDLNFSALEYNRLKQYYENQLDRLPLKEQNYVKLERDREAVSKTYVFLKEKLDESRILMGSEVGSVAIIGPAFLPIRPESPDIKTTLLIGLVFGGVMAGVYTYRSEMKDDAVRDISYFSDLYPGKVFGIPYIPGTDGNRLSVRNSNMRLSTDAFRKVPLISEIHDATFLESFRKLRIYLDYFPEASELHTLMVSGSMENEGKSTVCANLGIAFAQAGRKTVIVDTDLLHASMHQIFNRERERGLSDYLMTSSDGHETQYLQKTDYDNLYLLAAGREITAIDNVFNVDTMATLLKELEGRFDKVLLDASPLFSSDALGLAQLADRVLMVSRTGLTSRNAVHELLTDEMVAHGIVGVAVVDTGKVIGAAVEKVAES